MKNIAQKLEKAQATKRLSLDDYVSENEDDSALYVNICGNTGEFIEGDLVVIECNQKLR